MRKFNQLQNQFQEYLLRSNQDIAQHIVSTAKVPKEIRLAIYENAYRSRLQEALATSYPVLQTYLGCEQFEKFCLEYIDACPSPFRSMRWFGDNLAIFLKEHAEYSEHPYLSELAQFEWTCSLAFDAADAPTLQIEEMAAVPAEAWENMRFKAHPSIQRLNLSWNIVAIWQTITDDQTPPEPEENASPISWIVWRQNFSSHFISLPPDEAWAIDAILKNQTFGEICEGLCQWADEENAGLHAASLLKGWITSGLISELLL